MDIIKHLWNVNQFITKLNCLQGTNLQTHYIGKCRRLRQGIQLPSQNFGPLTMCQHCGSLWNTVAHTVRISRGKSPSKQLRKIIRYANNGNKRITKLQKSLMKKCLKNQTNKLVLKCSICSKSTQIPLNKPERKRIQKIDVQISQSHQKRKKKRTKDRTAGLNISGIANINVDITEGSSRLNTKEVGNTPNFIPTTQKLKKLNINRLKGIVNQDATPPKRRSLHSFLTELC